VADLNHTHAPIAPWSCPHICTKTHGIAFICPTSQIKEVSFCIWFKLPKFYLLKFRFYNLHPVYQIQTFKKHS